MKQPTESVRKPKHASFEGAFIWVALATAIFAGFAIAGHLSFTIGYQFSLGVGFLSFSQVHGHAQLMGWAGLFIIGISLHFIPRLSSVPIVQPHFIPQLLWVMGIGLLLRSVGQSTLPYLNPATPFFVFCSWLVALSGIIEWYGIVIYVLLLIGTMLGIAKTGKREALLSVRPYFGMMLAGFLLYATVNLVLLIQMALQNKVAVSQGWNEFAIEAFIGFVLLPVSFAMSIRMFPLYLRLPATDWHRQGVAYVYFLAVCLEIVTMMPINFGFSRITLYLPSIGMILKGGFIFWMVWKLDILTRLQGQWIAHRTLQPSKDRRPTRSKIPDYGEFGRFERLIYAAYMWLVMGALFDILIGGSMAIGHPLPISTDTVRHTYLLGFITNLIFGLAVRMIPGFMQKRRIASPKLVDVTFWLVNIAAIGRVLFLILPTMLFEVVPAMTIPVESAFAFSGILGLAAVICLTLNLWKTALLSRTLRVRGGTAHKT